VTASDPRRRLRDYVYERWAVIQRSNERFRPCNKLHERLDELTPREAEWFLESVTPHGSERALFRVEDDNKHRSHRYPPTKSGEQRGSVFFEKSGEKCSLRLETIVHQAAAWRLHSEFGWPLDYLVVESPDIVAGDQNPPLRREALDILVLESACGELHSEMTLAAARSRIGVEAKADRKELARLIEKMRDCQKNRLDPDDPRHADDHKKCNGIDVLRPSFFVGIAAGETWRVFPVVERGGHAVFDNEVSVDRLSWPVAPPG